MTRTFNGLVVRLFSHYRQTLDERDLDEYQRSFRGVPLGVMEAAIDLAIDTRKFRPTCSELREDVNRVFTERESQGHSSLSPRCDRCNGTGWISVSRPTPRRGRFVHGKLVAVDEPPSPAVRPCACRAARVSGATTSPRPTRIDDPPPGTETTMTRARDVVEQSEVVRRFRTVDGRKG